MKVDAWKAKDGSLHLTEEKQVMHDKQCALEEQVKVLAMGGVHGMRFKSDWNCNALTADDLPDFFMYMVEHYNEGLKSLLKTVDELHEMNIRRTR